MKYVFSKKDEDTLMLHPPSDFLAIAMIITFYRCCRNKWISSWNLYQTRQKNTVVTQFHWHAWALSLWVPNRLITIKDWWMILTRDSVRNSVTRRKNLARRARRRAATANLHWKCTGERVAERFQQMPGCVQFHSISIHLKAHCFYWILMFIVYFFSKEI